MPTLQEVTDAHSKRLSQLHQRRDAAFRDAMLMRDAQLRALPAAAAIYARFDKAVSAASEDRLGAEYKAAAARENALARAVEGRADGLADAHARRRAADLEALDRRARAEVSAERKFREALAGVSASTALELRQKITRDAERVRQREMDEAREAHASASAAAQAAYRAATDGALTGERKVERAAEQAHAAARRLAEAAEAAAVGAAERELFKSLQAIADAEEALARYRRRVTQIEEEAAAAERAEFARFREELAGVASTA